MTLRPIDIEIKRWQDRHEELNKQAMDLILDNPTGINTLKYYQLKDLTEDMKYCCAKLQMLIDQRDRMDEIRDNLKPQDHDKAG